ncbi:MAG: DNA polymerase IV, partial [Actinomycetota bacterium]
GRLWGVGPATERRLADCGLTTVGQVAALEAGVLQAKVGRAAGAHLAALAANRDPRAVVVGRRRRSVGSQRSFPAGSVDRDGAEQVIVEVVDRVARRLRAGARVARTVTLRLRDAEFAQATRSQTLPESTDRTDLILATAQGLLSDVWPELERRGVTKLGVAVSNLESDDAVQLALPFASADWGSVDQAMDEIRERFGSAAVTRATLAGRPSIEMPLLPDPPPG